MKLTAREKVLARGARCDICPLQGGTPVPADGPYDAVLAFVGEAPGHNEIRRGRPFVGRSGRMLNEVLEGNGLRREDVRLTNTICCRPPGDGNMATYIKDIVAGNKKAEKAYEKAKKARAKAIARNEKNAAKYVERRERVALKREAYWGRLADRVEKNRAAAAYNRSKAPNRKLRQGRPKPVPKNCRYPKPPKVDEVPPEPPEPTLTENPVDCCAPRLERELDRVQVIAPVGNFALEAITGETGIMSWAGSPMHGVGAFEGRPVVPTLHPAAILRGLSGYIVGFSHWIRKAVELARNPALASSWVEPDPATSYTATRRVLRRLLDAADAADAPIDVGADIETVGDVEDVVGVEIRCIGVEWEGGSAVLPLRGLDGRERVVGAVPVALMRRVLAHPNIRKWWHNGAFDISVLRAHGWEVEGPQADTLLAHHVLDPETPHGLGYVVSLFLWAPYWKEGLHAETDRELWQYNAQDCQRTRALAPHLLGALEREGLRHIYDQHVALIDPVCDAQIQGMEIDEGKRAEFRTEYEEIRERCVAEMLAELTPHAARFEEMTGDRLKDGFVWGASSKHLEAAMEILDINTGRWTPTGKMSTRAEDLLRAVPHQAETAQRFLGDKPTEKIPAKGLLGARAASKVLSTFIDPPLCADGRVRPSWKQHGTPTGRWASEHPNFQNVPKKLRALYRARAGNVLVGADYSALELWMIAIAADAKYLLKALQSSDAHRANAQGIFTVDFVEYLKESVMAAWPASLPPPTFQLDAKLAEAVWPIAFEELPDRVREAYDTARKRLKQWRDLAKRYVYGSNYGGSAQTIYDSLASQLAAEQEDVKLELNHVIKMDTRWKALNPEIATFGMRNYETYYKRKRRHRYGWLETPVLGRRRYWFGDELIHTDAANYPIQGGAADVVNSALVRLYPHVRALGGWLAQQGHDALVFEVPEQRVDEVSALMHELMPAKVPVTNINGETAEWAFPIELDVGTHLHEV